MRHATVSMMSVIVVAHVLLISSLLRIANAQGCGGNVVSSPATISSPNFPRSYPANAFCQWVVQAPAGKSVQIKVMRFSLGGDFDMLRIFDGVNVTCDTPITVYTNEDSAAGLTLLLGQNVTIAFSSDDSVSATGFRLSVTFISASSGSSGVITTTTPSSSGCGASLAGSGRLTSPNYPAPYAPNERCIWHLTPNNGQQITIRIVNLQLESPWDRLRVYQSSSPGANEIPVAEYTGTVSGAMTSLKVGSAVTVVFESDESIQKTGFEAVFYSNTSSVTPAVPSASLPMPDTCGVPAVTITTKAVEDSSRIVGGVAAPPQAWPWQVQLLYLNQFICGGSLISSQWVVTAAHCILKLNPKSFTVLLGKYYQYKTDATLKRSAVSKIVVHPEYDAIVHNSDMALIKLTQPVSFTTAIRPVCLPQSDFTPGANCFVTGWGDTKVSATGIADVLQQASIPILSRNCCGNFLQNSFTKNMTCAGYITGGKDTCQGDSGGPLVCQLNGTFWLYGVTSWGVGCADPYLPGVYTRVPGFINWIRQVVSSN